MKNPYCQDCGNICKTVKNGIKSYTCTGYLKRVTINKWGNKFIEKRVYQELEFDDGLVLKCPQCIRSEDRMGCGK
jgi:hypothetical protein